MNRKSSQPIKRTPASAAGATGVLNPPEPVMDCADFHSVLAQVLERDDLPPAALLHLNECMGCESMIRDFETIALRVRRLVPLELETVPDQWPSIRLELLREGIIHSSDCLGDLPPLPKLVQGTSTPRRPR